MEGDELPALSAAGNPTHAALACRAVRERRCLDLSYGGTERRVEVHAVGRSGDGTVVMRVWQVSGESHSARTGWKLMSLAAVTATRLSNEPSRAPRPGFNPVDPAMSGGVICEV